MAQVTGVLLDHVQEHLAHGDRLAAAEFAKITGAGDDTFGERDF